VNDVEVIVMVVPSEFFAATLATVPAAADAVIVSATKGFDPVRHARMTELMRERLPRARIAALSGPTFAREVAQGSPTAAVIAAPDDALASMLQGRLHHPGGTGGHGRPRADRDGKSLAQPLARHGAGARR
jgi:glycerol-3-phosphate dehydrogenase (NAD(P)+)